MQPLVIQGTAKKGLSALAGLVSTVNVDIDEHAGRTHLIARGHSESDPLPSSIKAVYVRLDVFLEGDFGAKGVRWAVDGSALKRALTGAKPARLVDSHDGLEVFNNEQTVTIQSDDRLATQQLHAYFALESEVSALGHGDWSRFHLFNLAWVGKVAQASPVRVGEISPAWVGKVPALEVSAAGEDGVIEWTAYVAGVRL